MYIRTVFIFVSIYIYIYYSYLVATVVVVAANTNGIDSVWVEPNSGTPRLKISVCFIRKRVVRLTRVSYALAISQRPLFVDICSVISAVIVAR